MLGARTPTASETSLGNAAVLCVHGAVTALRRVVVGVLRLAVLMAVFGGATGVGLGCVRSSSIDTASRFYAVHTAMQATAMTQSGGVSRGFLGASQTAKLQVNLSAQCYTVVAVGGEGVQDLALSLRNQAGNELVANQMSGPDAAVRWCVERPGPHWIHLTMRKGSGAFALGTWTEPASDRASTSNSSDDTTSAAGTCNDPIPLDPLRQTHDNTERGNAIHEGRCGVTDGKELVFRLDVAEASRVTIRLMASFDGVLYLRSGVSDEGCIDSDAELACNDDEGQENESLIELVLQPGSYFVIVDGRDNEDAGPFRLSVSMRAEPTSRRASDKSIVLTAGETRVGTIHQSFGEPQNLCSHEPSSSRVAYSLDVTQLSRLRWALQHQVGYRLWLQMQRMCGPVQCGLPLCSVGVSGPPLVLGNAGDPSARERPVHFVEPGHYRVWVDTQASWTAASDIAFWLRAELTPAQGRGVKGDGCSDAISLADSSGTVMGDLFDARNDVATSCEHSGIADVVYRVDLREKSRLVARAKGHVGAFPIALQRVCAGAKSQIACDSAVAHVLEPGPYWLVIKANQIGDASVYQLDYRVQPWQAMRRDCAAAPVLQQGRDVTGSTVGKPDRFAIVGSADISAPGRSDQVYQFRLQKRMSVNVQLTRKQGPLTLSVSKDCFSDPVQEYQCNTRSNSSCSVSQVLSPGTYHVVVESDTQDGSQYTLRLQTNA